MALATSNDVSDVIGRDLTSDETTRANLLLESASRYVESRTGRRLSPGSYTVGRKVRCGRVALPATAPAVSAVRSVNQRTGAETALSGSDWTLRGSTLYVTSGACFVEVDFTTATAVPPALVAIVAGVVGGLITMPAAGVSSETAGPYQVTFGNNSGRIYFSASDLAIIDSFRLPNYPVDLP